MFDQLLEILPQIVTYLVLVTAVFTTSLWLGMVLWVFRDIRSRTRDLIVQILATLMVAVLTVPGLIIYFLIRPRETLAEAYEHALEQEALLQAVEEPEVCPSCGAKARGTYLYCPYCHTQLKKKCVTCGEVIELEWNLCPYCGASQGTQVVEPVMDRDIEVEEMEEQPQEPVEV
jgi:RNA polymerase subunit RPABC4/transcription elongation factor Spt4